MSWIQKCCRTYESNLHMAGKLTANRSPLCPLYFITEKAQIEVTLTEDGRFVQAREVPEQEPEILIPVTENSASRGNGVFPRPLCDQLKYVALGHESYPGHASYAKNFAAYLQLLGSWAQSAQSHYIVRAVYAYCQSGNLIRDLAASGLIKCDEKGFLKSRKVYEKALVRWRVVRTGKDVGECWSDASLFESYRAFWEAFSAKAKKGVCFVTGKEAVIAGNHPDGIIQYKNRKLAKLISSNDNVDFSFRGRFVKAEQAFSVGQESTQQAHSALRWLAANQGISYGERTFVCWNPCGRKVPPPDSYSLFALQDDEEELPATLEQYRDLLKRALSGYRNAFGTDDESKPDRSVCIISLEAATKGRLSVTYYNELDGSDFLDRIERWNQTCCWEFLHFTPDRKPCRIVETPSARTIAAFAFGAQQNDFVTADDNMVAPRTRCVD